MPIFYSHKSWFFSPVYMQNNQVPIILIKWTIIPRVKENENFKNV